MSAKKEINSREELMRKVARCEEIFAELESSPCEISMNAFDPESIGKAISDFNAFIDLKFIEFKDIPPLMEYVEVKKKEMCGMIHYVSLFSRIQSGFKGAGANSSKPIIKF